MEAIAEVTGLGPSAMASCLFFRWSSINEQTEEGPCHDARPAPFTAECPSEPVGGQLRESSCPWGGASLSGDLSPRSNHYPETWPANDSRLLFEVHIHDYKSDPVLHVWPFCSAAPVVRRAVLAGGRCCSRHPPRLFTCHPADGDSGSSFLIDFFSDYKDSQKVIIKMLPF